MKLKKEYILMKGQVFMLSHPALVKWNENTVAKLVKFFTDNDSKYKFKTFIINNIYEDPLVIEKMLDTDIFRKFFHKKKNKINFYIINGCMPNKDRTKYIIKDPEIVNCLYFFPLIFLYEYKNKHDFKLSDKAKVSSKSKPFISMNNQPRDHRIKFIDTIAKHNLWDKFNLSFLIEKDEDMSHNFEHWKTPRRLQLDTDDDTTIIVPGSNYYSQIPNEYHTSFIDIVAETSFEQTQFSEKTLRPLLLSKLFIIIGHQTMNTTLRDIFKFKLYENVFDYDKYESFTNLQDRLDFLCDSLSKMKDFTFDDSMNKIAKYNLENVQKLRRFSNKYFYDVNGNTQDFISFCDGLKLKVQNFFTPSQNISIEDRYIDFLRTPYAKHLC